LDTRKAEREMEERIDPNLDGEFIFIHKTKPPKMGELQNCIGGGSWRVLEGLDKFFKSNLCCYNALKTKIYQS